MSKERIVLEPILNNLNITNKAVRKKAAELMRVLDIRSPQGLSNAGPGVDACKYVCNRHHQPFDREKALAVFGGNSKTYQIAYTTVTSILGINPPISLAEVGIKLGLPEVTKPALKVLEKYKERFLSGLPENKRKDADFSKNSFPAAAFYLCAQHMKAPIDKSYLLEITDTTPEDFMKAQSSIYELIFKPFESSQPSEEKDEQQSSTPQASTKKRTASELADGDKVQSTAKRRKLTEQRQQTSKEKVAEKHTSPKKDDLAEIPKSYLNESLNTDAINMQDQQFDDEIRSLKYVDPQAEKKAEEERKKKEEYEAWRQQVLSTPTQPSRKATKQLTLNFGGAQPASL